MVALSFSSLPYLSGCHSPYLFFSDPLFFHSFYFIDTGANHFFGKKVSEDNDTIFFKVSNLFFGKRIVQIIIRIPFLHFIDIIEK